MIGAAAIVVGGSLLSKRPPGDRSWRRRDLVFAGLAAVGFAVRDNVTRYGFRDFADPVLAAAVSTATSVAIMWTYGSIAARRELRVEWLGLKLVSARGGAEGWAHGGASGSPAESAPRAAARVHDGPGQTLPRGSEGGEGVDGGLPRPAAATTAARPAPIAAAGFGRLGAPHLDLTAIDGLAVE